MLRLLTKVKFAKSLKLEKVRTLKIQGKTLLNESTLFLFDDV